MTIYAGIDPGVSGAFVALNEKGALVSAWRLPVIGPPKHRHFDSVSFSRALKVLDGQKVVAAIEELVPMPRQNQITTMASGKLFGAMVAVLELANCSVRYVRSQAWQKPIGGLPTPPPTKGLDDKDRARIKDQHRKALKGVIQLRARLACPEIGVAIDGLGSKSDGIADAFWIATWGRMNSGSA